MGIPEGVREVIGRRLSRLPEAANEVLATASVLGRRFDLALLAAVCGDPFDIVLEHLEAAERANLVRPSSASGSYSFAHALVRSTLYDELPTSRRLRLHRDAGLALEGFGAVDDHLADLARHFGEAAALGEARRAVDYGLRAGDRASADLAFEEAMSHYERALLALELPGEVGPDDRRRLLLALGTAQSHAGDPSHVATLYEAADLARDAGDATDLAEAAIAIGYHRFARAAVGSQDPQLLALLEEALDGIAPEDMAIRSRLHAQIAAVLMFGEGTERRRWHESDESLRLARAVGDPGLLSDILGFRIAVYDSGNADAVGRYREELTERVALAEAINDYQLLLALLARSPIPVLGGNRAATEADLDRARELAPRLRVAALEHRLAVLDSAMLLLDGRLEEAEAAMMAWVAFADRHGLSWTDAIGGQYYRLRYEQGRLDELIPTLLERVEVAPTVAGWRVAAAGAYAQIGQPDEAREHLRVLAADQFAVVGHDINWLMVMAGTARSAAMVGEDDIAARAYELALPFRGELAWTGVTFEQPVDLSLGTAAARLGRFDVAEDHFRASLELSERVRAPTFVAVTRLHWAQALADRDGAGDGTRSRELAAMALATAEELGLGRILRVARDLLA
jgi:tetratricopeptide (TPR) repeat protein